MAAEAERLAKFNVIQNTEVSLEFEVLTAGLSFYLEHGGNRTQVLAVNNTIIDGHTYGITASTIDLGNRKGVVTVVEYKGARYSLSGNDIDFRATYGADGELTYDGNNLHMRISTGDGVQELGV